MTIYYDAEMNTELTGQTSQPDIIICDHKTNHMCTNSFLRKLPSMAFGLLPEKNFKSLAHVVLS